MRRLHTDEAPVGATLAVSVLDESPRPPLEAGLRLTAEHLDDLRDRGYCRILILDNGEPIEPEFIPAEARAEALRALTPAVGFLLETWRGSDTATPDDGHELDRALRAASRRFVDEGCAEATLRLPDPVRRGSAQWLDDAVNAAAVALYLGRAFRLDEDALSQPCYGMLLRDVAMLAIPPDLMETPGSLSEEAWQAVHGHPERAYETLGQLDWMDETSRLVVLQHHERRDGSGYPHGIGGLNTVLRSAEDMADPTITQQVSDIAAIADVFNALTVDRPHRPGHAPHRAAAMLRSSAAATLNAEVVDLPPDRWRPPDEDLVPAASQAASA